MLAQFVDIHGSAKAKAVPVEHLDMVVIRGGLGPELSREFIRLKRMESTEYSRHVSDWETRRYLEFF